MTEGRLATSRHPVIPSSRHPVIPSSRHLITSRVTPAIASAFRGAHDECMFDFLTRFLRYRGTSAITFPETLQHAAVEVDALHAALADEMRLRTCSRWPEKAGCDQACLHQIEARP